MFVFFIRLIDFNLSMTYFCIQTTDNKQKSRIFALLRKNYRKVHEEIRIIPIYNM